MHGESGFIAILVPGNLLHLCEGGAGAICNARTAGPPQLVLQPCPFPLHNLLSEPLFLLIVVRRCQQCPKCRNTEGGGLTLAGDVQDFRLELLRRVRANVILPKEGIDDNIVAIAILDSLAASW